MRYRLHRVDPRVLLAVGVVLTGGGLWLAYGVGKPILDNAQASSQWPGVVGTIQSSRVAESRSSKGRRNYSADVRYLYAVGDRSYTGNTVWFGDNYKSSNASQAHATVERFRPGAKVPVFYDPARPDVAVLDPGVSHSSYAVFAIGWVVAGIGCVICTVLLVKRFACRNPLPEQLVP